MTTFVCRRTGRTYEVGDELDHRGQAAVHLVEPASSGLALKRYLPGTVARRPDLEARVKAMLAAPPAYRTDPSGSVVCAWPEDAAYIADRFVGFVMPRVDVEGALRVRDVATSPDRTWRDRVVVAENLARAVATLHDADVVVGDFREENLLTWDDGRVTLLGCDRMQVEDPGSGRRFPCVADRNACTPPELPPMSSALRTRSSDIFPLALMLHLLLLQGAHPFRGAWRGGGDPPAEYELARAGLWSYAGDRRLLPKPDAPLLDVLPERLRECFWAAFVDGARRPGARPPAQEWLDALVDLRTSLVTGTPVVPPVTVSAHPPPRADAAERVDTVRMDTGRMDTGRMDTGPAAHPTLAGRSPSSARRPRRRTRAVAWASGAVVGLGVLVGVASTAGRSAPAVTGSAVTIPARVTATQGPGARPADPTEALRWIRTQDAATVDALAESWVPQLSTRPAVAQAADRSAADAAIVAGHDALRRQHPGAVLLWSSDWNYDGQFWITVVNARFGTAEETNAWCDTQGFAGRDCFAKKLSRSGVVAGSARYRG